jgi:hypothetical protein
LWNFRALNDFQVPPISFPAQIRAKSLEQTSHSSGSAFIELVHAKVLRQNSIAFEKYKIARS